MSYRTKAAAIAVAFSFGLSAAHAAVECPGTSQGHALEQWGGTLYQGDPVNDMSLAPSQENPGNRGVNYWKTPDPVGIILVCRYVGLPVALKLPLTPDVKGCAQNVGSFVCR